MSNSFKFDCPNCQARCRAEEERAGKKFKCPKCGAIGIVPAFAPIAVLPCSIPPSAVEAPATVHSTVLTKTAPPTIRVVAAEPAAPQEINPLQPSESPVALSAGKWLAFVGGAAKHVLEVPGYYWANRSAFGKWCRDFRLQFDPSSGSRCEIRLSAKQDYDAAQCVDNRWEVRLPGCCVHCGLDGLDMPCRDETHTVPDVTGPLLALILTLPLAVAALFWHGWLLPIVLVAGMTIGYSLRRSIVVDVRYCRCVQHEAHHYPTLSGFGNSIIIRVGHKNVRRAFDLIEQPPAAADAERPLSDASSRAGSSSMGAAGGIGVATMPLAAPVPNLDPIPLIDEPVPESRIIHWKTPLAATIDDRPLPELVAHRIDGLAPPNLAALHKPLPVPGCRTCGQPFELFETRCKTCEPVPPPAAVPVSNSAEPESFEIQKNAHCESCGRPMAAEAVLCLECGWNRSTFTKLERGKLPEPKPEPARERDDEPTGSGGGSVVGDIAAEVLLNALLGG